MRAEISEESTIENTNNELKQKEQAETMTSRNFLIYGASRGIGGGFSAGLPNAGDHVWLVSRSQPEVLDHPTDGVTYEWIAADLSQVESAELVAEAVGNAPIDVLIYNAGLWEKTGWTPAYDFATNSPEENTAIMAVGLTVAVHCLQRLIPNVLAPDRANIILTSSINGVDNNGARAVAYSAAKFGMRGVAHALREELRAHNVAVTVLNPGAVANHISYHLGDDAVFNSGDADSMPISDMVKLIEAVLSLSPNACVKEITVPAMSDVGI